jgi:hypothetical protein
MKLFFSMKNNHPFLQSEYSPKNSNGDGRVSSLIPSDRYKQGFFCGFWKLLLVVWLGVATDRGGIDLVHSSLVATDSSSCAMFIYSPSDATDTISKSVSNFFSNCSECVANFGTNYENCEINRRSTRLSSTMT